MLRDLMALITCSALLGGCFLDGAGQQRFDGGGLDAGTCGRAETCNGEDDDCDGTTDEDASMACGSAGTCTAGTRACVDGALMDCVPEGTTAAETCDGTVDEDCDGTVDEGCGCATGDERACGDEEGACAPGTQVCSDETWGPCEGAVGPTAETCNEADDDCNGVVDDGIAPEPCGSETGQCTMGTRTCVGGALTDCSGVLPRAEECDGAMLDEDCDGMSNEDCECTPRTVEACTSGACIGSRTCDATGRWGACDAITSTAETCNGADDDCDGRIDEGNGITLTPSPCSSGLDRIHVPGADGHAYIIVYNPALGWTDARADCTSLGYDLIVIETEAENDAVIDAIGLSVLGGGPSEYWIGLSDTTAVNGDYRWPDGSLPTYDGWASGEPSHNDQCAMLDYGRTDEPSGGWDDKGCGGGKAYICESPPATMP